jgi:predicted nuclease of predicted toxin-antitoxin system
VRILLDGCVPSRLKAELPGNEVATVHDRGWSNLDDGPLLRLISGEYDLFVTTDKSIPKQQVLVNRPFGVVILRAKTNRLQDLMPLVPRLLQLVGRSLAGEVHELRAPDL